MVPDRQNVRTDGRNGRMDDAKTISLRLRRGIKNNGQAGPCICSSYATKSGFLATWFIS